MENLKVRRKKAKVQFKSYNFEFWFVIFTFAFLLLPFTAAACPMCKESLFDPGQLAQKIATSKGYALSIGMLLAVPFTLVAVVISLVARSARRSRAAISEPLDGVDTPHKTR